MFSRSLFLSWLLAGICWSQPVHAHFLWIVTQPDGQTTQAQLYFSERAQPDDPKLLERVKDAEVWLVGSGSGPGAKPEKLALTLEKERLTARLPAERRFATVAVKHTYGVLDKGGEQFLLKYYAKSYPSTLPGTWKAVNHAELLPLEILPELDGTKLAVRVLWQTKPQAGAEVVIESPALDKKLSGTTDDYGYFRCELSQTGTYSIRAKHLEKAAGTHADKAYQSVRHYATVAVPFSSPQVFSTKHKLPDLTRGTTSFGGAIEGDWLYVYGGNYGGAHRYSSEEQSGDFIRLNLRDPHKWESLPGGPKLTGLALVPHRGKLYRVGGFTVKNAAKEEHDLWSQPDFARFDPQTKKWEALPPLPEPRSSLDAAMIGDTLYVVGGWDIRGPKDTHWHETAWSIDLSANTLQWKSLPKPPFLRRALTLANANGKLYCLGGMQKTGGSTTATAVFDPANGTWSEGPNLLGNAMDGFGASAFACSGQLFVTTMSGAIQRLSANGDRWELVGQLQNPRFFHRMLPWNDRHLVVVGGASMTSGKVVELELLLIPPTTASQPEKAAAAK